MLQKVNYTYTIRGWLLGINDVANLNIGAPASDPKDLFAFAINYKDTVANNVGGTIVPLYNGNIAETSWRSDTDNVLRRYGYSYDKLNRLTTSVYQKPGNAVPVTNMYNESMRYDKNGNIKELKRNGDYDSNIYAAVQIDHLEYGYKSGNPNQLLTVTDHTNSPKGFADDSITDPTDASVDYAYDSYGNMISDENKNITSIIYNHLDLPTEINFGTGNKIQYLYDAVGQKLRKKVTEGTTETVTDYLDGFQYTDTKLDFFQHAEGYVKVTQCSACEVKIRCNYVYQYKDHLGNIRLSYGYDEAEEKVKVIEENHYYPYGLKHMRYNSIEKKYEANEDELMELEEVPSGEPGMNKYKYNGKEWQDELGLNMYAMDMRQYDPAIGRWVVQDPIVHVSQSPYNGYDGNPVVFADPSGGNAGNIVYDGQGREKVNEWGVYIDTSNREDAVNDNFSGPDGGREEEFSDIKAKDEAFDPPLNTFLFDGKSLKYVNENGDVIFETEANSGVGIDMNNANSQSKENKGPVPEGNYYLKLDDGVTPDWTGGGWGKFALRLNEKFTTKMKNRILYERGGFFLHQDGNADSGQLGSHGCIAIYSEAGTDKVWNELKSLQKRGFDSINIVVKYPQPSPIKTERNPYPRWFGL